MAKILTIEDDPSFQDLLRLHLRSAGHAVRAASDPEEGLRSILEDPPELILLDLDLPYLSGFEVLQALRADKASRSIPVIVVTGRADADTYDRCRKIGFAGFVSKPLKREDLLSAIGKALGDGAK